MVVTFGEEGYWTNEILADKNPDNAQWEKTGWRVRNYDGEVLIRDNERGPCIDWLHNNGFKVCADSEHWQKEGEVSNG